MADEGVGRPAVPAAALAAHRRAVEAGSPTYSDPETGYLVLTAPALAERGACCGRGCRHCPYGPEGAKGPEG
jgi:hypothetical protein